MQGTREHERGFSLIELLLVLAILGIVSAIAIPTYLGQRRRAQNIGDAASNAKVLQMLLTSRWGETGVYGIAGGSVSWVKGSNDPALVGFSSNPLPSFSPRGNTQMNYQLTFPTALTYILKVSDSSRTGGTQVNGGALVYQTDQTGSVIFQLN